MQYNNVYLFNELDGLNKIRNRIAHHEPICFLLGADQIDVGFVIHQYQRVQTLFLWMGIDACAMLYGLDHVQKECDKVLLIR